MAMPLKPISITAATVTLDRHIHRDVVSVLNRAAGVTVTLPAAVGSGDIYKIMVGTTVTSNNDIVKVANSTDIMVGAVATLSTSLATQSSQAAGGTNDTITMNGTTTGGIVGSYMEIIDSAAGFWCVQANLIGSGTIATSLSATV